MTGVVNAEELAQSPLGETKTASRIEPTCEMHSGGNDCANHPCHVNNGFSIVGPKQERPLSRAPPSCFAVVSATGGQAMAPIRIAREREKDLASMAAYGRC